MKKFTWHIQDKRGEFVDIKVNSTDLIKDFKKYTGKNIVIWSVTDPYQAIEEKYQITKNILEKLIWLSANIDIITKSKLVIRDIDLFKHMKWINIVTSFCANDESIKQLFEENSPSLQERKESLKTLHEHWIHTTLFISPLLPEITAWKEIVEDTKDYVDEYRFENLNLYPSIKKTIYQIIHEREPKLVEKYQAIYEWSEYEEYRNQIASDIREFCQKKWVKYKIYFHHKDNKK